MTRALDEALKQAADISLMAHANLLLNGFHALNQEYALGTGATSDKFAADQWPNNSPLPGAYAAQVAAPFPSMPDIALGLRFTAPGTRVLAAGDIAQIFQPIEGLNLGRLRYGNANARPVTVAFMLRASYTGVAAFNLYNVVNNRSWVRRLAFNANEDTFFCFTVPGDVVAALSTGNVASLSARWIVAAGTTYQTASLEAWVPGILCGSPDISNIAAVAGQNLTIGACVMVPGSFKISQDILPLLQRRYEDELRLCQRYFALVYTGARLGMPGYQAFTEMMMNMPVPMRLAPSGYLVTAGASQNMLGGYPQITVSSNLHTRFIIAGSAGNTDSYALNYLYAFNARM
jgi:hypothetical protein